uniref:Multifunctional fusion protein n=1 Tax=Plectus sambesii TaxID=2011161 RepID=A0A914VMQ6_9BILA
MAMMKCASLRRVSATRNFSGLTSADFMKKPTNEPILEYKKGSKERTALEEAIKKYSSKETVVPLRIGKEKINGKLDKRQPMPFDHKRTLAKFSYATKDQIKSAIEATKAAREDWEKKPLKERADIILHAADLCATKYRMALNATTMLGQAKNIIQAEIDAACELIDFLRFNAFFALQHEKYQPISTKISTNKMIFRGLEGFVAAIAPFNFTAIGGNLASAPALMGNTVLWKPSDTAVLSNYIIFEILEEAGIPPGVLNFLPSDGPVFGDTVTADPSLGAINFTGSVPTFKYLWRKVAENLDNYESFPRLVGECGGKNFHFVHKSADLDSVAAGTIRSAYEYQGQKCSAVSRMYVPESVWPKLREKIESIRKNIKMGDATDGSVFMSSVIDKKAFDRVKGYVEMAKNSSDFEVVAGGKCDDSKGYFVEPTIIQSKRPDSKLMTEEIFGPVLTVYSYPDKDTEKTLNSVKDATPYGLTGAVFSNDKEFLYKARDTLKDAVGNLYLNDKSTGSIVGQQPFGGSRMSGTNDKAGSPYYVLKWTSPQTIKETSVPLHEWRYPSMD